MAQPLNTHQTLDGAAIRAALHAVKQAVVTDHEKPDSPEAQRALIDACKAFIHLMPQLPYFIAELDHKIAGLMNVLLVTANNTGPHLADIIHQQAHDCAPAEYHHAFTQLQLLMADAKGNG